MERGVSGLLEDELAHWLAELVCGDYQVVGHVTPWVIRQWLMTT
jgi:hypothetical protein